MSEMNSQQPTDEAILHSLSVKPSVPFRDGDETLSAEPLVVRYLPPEDLDGFPPRAFAHLGGAYTDHERAGQDAYQCALSDGVEPVLDYVPKQAELYNQIATAQLRHTSSGDVVVAESDDQPIGNGDPHIVVITGRPDKGDSRVVSRHIVPVGTGYHATIGIVRGIIGRLNREDSPRPPSIQLPFKPETVRVYGLAGWVTRDA